jgi:hypothetical protein
MVKKVLSLHALTVFFLMFAQANDGLHFLVDGSSWVKTARRRLEFNISIDGYPFVREAALGVEEPSTPMCDNACKRSAKGAGYILDIDKEQELRFIHCGMHPTQDIRRWVSKKALGEHNLPSCKKNQHESAPDFLPSIIGFHDSFINATIGNWPWADRLRFLNRIYESNVRLIITSEDTTVYKTTIVVHDKDNNTFNIPLLNISPLGIASICFNFDSSSVSATVFIFDEQNKEFVKLDPINKDSIHFYLGEAPRVTFKDEDGWEFIEYAPEVSVPLDASLDNLHLFRGRVQVGVGYHEPSTPLGVDQADDSR